MGAILLALAILLAVIVVGLLAFTASVTGTIRKRMTPRGRFVDTAAGRLHVVETGEGPPVVMIHGLAGNLANFGYALFEPLKGEFRLIAMDRPGSGHSPREEGRPVTLEGHAAAAAALIEALGLVRPLVVGHSMGGAIALTLARTRPDLVGGLVLLAPATTPQAHLPDVFWKLGFRSPLLRRLFARTLNVPLSILHSRRTMATIFGPDPAPADFAVRGGGLLGLLPETYQSACEDLRCMEAGLPAVAAHLPEAPGPLTVVYGTEDRVLDEAVHGRAFPDRVPHARYVTLSGGHMLPVTAPDLCAQAIRETAAAMRSAAA